jgi:hypothetical protein
LSNEERKVFDAWQKKNEAVTGHLEIKGGH